MSINIVKGYKNTYNIYVCVFICVLCLSITDCCRFGSGPNCAFPCNCNNNGCDQETGDCSGYGGCRSTLPIGYGWAGPGCLLGNVAFGKESTQSSTYGRFNASLGNDGDNLCEGNHFSHTEQDNPAWFKIDLGGKYRIQNVIVYRLDGYIRRLVGSKIQMIDGSNVQDCANITPDNHSEIMTFTCDMIGDAVRIYRDIDISFIVICEVVVMGHIYIEKIEDCQTWENDAVGCRTCQAGKKLPDCKHDCPSGYYGVNCQYRCSSGCKSGSSSICNVVSGRCQNGCQVWYIGDKCDTVIVELPIYDNDVSATSTSSSITITWKAARPPQPGTKANYHYIIVYKLRSDGIYTETSAISLIDDMASAQSYTLLNLKYNTEYEYVVRSVRATWEMTEFYEASAMSIKSKCIAPEVPAEINITGEDASFRASWKTDVTMLNSGCDTMTIILEYKYTNNEEWQSLDISGRRLSEYSFPSNCYVQIWAKLTATNNERLVSSTEIVTAIAGLSPKGIDTITLQTNTPHDISQTTPCPSYEEMCGSSDSVMNAGISMMVISVIIAVAAVLGAVVYVRRARQQLADKKSFAAPVSEQMMSNIVKTEQPEEIYKTDKNHTAYYNMTPYRNGTTDYEDVHPINDYQTLDNRQVPTTPLNTVYQSLE